VAPSKSERFTNDLLNEGVDVPTLFGLVNHTEWLRLSLLAGVSADATGPPMRPKPGYSSDSSIRTALFFAFTAFRVGSNTRAGSLVLMCPGGRHGEHPGLCPNEKSGLKQAALSER